MSARSTSSRQEEGLTFDVAGQFHHTVVRGAQAFTSTLCRQRYPPRER